MGSNPTFDPTVLARPITQARTTRSSARRPARRWSTARSPACTRPARRSSRSPRWRRWRRAITPDTPIDDHGCVKIGEQELCNAGKTAWGTVALRQRAAGVLRRLLLHAGRDLNPLGGQPLQRWARRLGFGRRTGIDLPGEFGGTIPDRRWRGAQPAEAECRASAGAGLRDRRRTGRGRSATTSTSRSARATSRPPRCRWRSPTPPSPTAAASCARTWAPRRGRQRPAAAPGDRAAALAAREDRPRRPPGDHGRPARWRRWATARRPTSSRAGTSAPSPSSARPAPPRRPAGGPVLVRGLRARRAAARSSSPSPSRRAASAPRPPRRSRA